MADVTSPLPHKQHYDVRIASQTHSNIATVLAGFAFAAVILVMQISNLPTAVADAATLRDWATIAFLIAFFGCIIAAFTFAVVAGEEALAPRSFAIALLGGAGFSLSSVYIIWGLVLLARIFLSAEVAEFSRWIFFLTILIVPFYLILTAIDPLLSFDRKPINRKSWITLAAPSYITIASGVLLSLFKVAAIASFLSSLFKFVVAASLLSIVISGIRSLLAAEQELTSHISPRASSTWIFVHSLVFSLLVLYV